VPEDPQASMAPAASPDARRAESSGPPEPAGELQVAFTSAPPGLRLAGEIDTTTRAAFARALALAMQSGPGDVHADLGGVSFIDVDGLRALVATASSLGGGRMLVLNSVPAHVARLLELTGWDAAPGLRIGR
jgi:anti-anti-sigma factor